MSGCFAGRLERARLADGGRATRLPSSIVKFELNDANSATRMPPEYVVLLQERMDRRHRASLVYVTLRRLRAASQQHRHRARGRSRCRAGMWWDSCNAMVRSSTAARPRVRCGVPPHAILPSSAGYRRQPFGEKCRRRSIRAVLRLGRMDLVAADSDQLVTLH
jgi:hypothetical protein